MGPTQITPWKNIFWCVQTIEEGLKYFSHAHKINFKSCISSRLSTNCLCQWIVHWYPCLQFNAATPLFKGGFLRNYASKDYIPLCFICKFLMQSDQTLAIYKPLNVKCAFLFFDSSERKNHSSKMTRPICLKFYT